MMLKESANDWAPQNLTNLFWPMERVLVRKAPAAFTVAAVAA